MKIDFEQIKIAAFQDELEKMALSAGLIERAGARATQLASQFSKSPNKAIQELGARKQFQGMRFNEQLPSPISGLRPAVNPRANLGVARQGLSPEQNRAYTNALLKPAPGTAAAPVATKAPMGGFKRKAILVGSGAGAGAIGATAMMNRGQQQPQMAQY